MDETPDRTIGSRSPYKAWRRYGGTLELKICGGDEAAVSPSVSPLRFTTAPLRNFRQTAATRDAQARRGLARAAPALWLWFGVREQVAEPMAICAGAGVGGQFRKLTQLSKESRR